MAEVVLKDISKVYEDSTHAVRDVSVEIADREFMVFVGPSGCGKTTVLRMIAGLEEVTSGTIIIGAQVVNDIPPKQRDIAMVFQHYALYPHMSVAENMAFGLKLRKMKADDVTERVKDAAKILNLTHLLDKKPKALSGGERQRTAVGRAIVRKPAVFLFDEPLSNLDAKLRVQMRGEISRLHRKLKATMIYVTHDQVEAMSMADRIAVMNRGKIMQVAKPFEIYKSPANTFVAGFIGTPPMNFLSLSVNREGSEAVLRTKGMEFTVQDQRAARVLSLEGSEITVGFRPEHGFEEEGIKVKAIVDIIEPVGSKVLCYVRLESGETAITEMAPEKAPAPGQSITLSINRQKMYFFDREGTAIA